MMRGSKQLHKRLKKKLPAPSHQNIGAKNMPGCKNPETISIEPRSGLMVAGKDKLASAILRHEIDAKLVECRMLLRILKMCDKAHSIMICNAIRFVYICAYQHLTQDESSLFFTSLSLPISWRECSIGGVQSPLRHL
jgi:hypothetical protein